MQAMDVSYEREYKFMTFLVLSWTFLVFIVGKFLCISDTESIKFIVKLRSFHSFASFFFFFSRIYKNLQMNLVRQRELKRAGRFWEMLTLFLSTNRGRLLLGRKSLSKVVADLLNID